MSNAVRRALRTFLQSFVGSLITSGVLSATATTGIVDWSALKKVALAALAGAIVATLTFAQNALEDAGAVPALLKRGDTGAVNWAVVCVLLLVLTLVLIATGHASLDW